LGIVGIAGELLVIRTEQGLQALGIADGSTKWRYDAAELYGFPLVDDQRLLVASRERVHGEKDRWQVRLTWVDPATGAAIASTLLDALTDADPRIGPLVPYQDRLFTFFGKGQHEAAREVVELAPAGEADHPPQVQNAWFMLAQRLD
jgi:hypothetical protein